MAKYSMTFGQVDGNVNVDISPSRISYPVLLDVVNGTIVGTIQDTVQQGSSFTVTVKANNGYTLSNNYIFGTGADVDMSPDITPSQYLLYFSNIVGPVRFRVEFTQ